MLELFRKNAMGSRETRGRQSQWALNKESVLVNDVSRMINRESKIYRQLESKTYETLIKEKTILKGVLWGPAARKKEKPNSLRSLI